MSNTVTIELIMFICYLFAVNPLYGYNRQNKIYLPLGMGQQKYF